MREIRSYGSVGERGVNEPLYPDSTPGRSGNHRHGIALGD